MTPRFFFDEPRPASVADRLLESATQLEVKVFKRPSGVTVMTKLESVMGADFLGEDGDEHIDHADEARKSYQAMADLRTLLAAFAMQGGGA